MLSGKQAPFISLCFPGITLPWSAFFFWRPLLWFYGTRCICGLTAGSNCHSWLLWGSHFLLRALKKYSGFCLNFWVSGKALPHRSRRRFLFCRFLFPGGILF